MVFTRHEIISVLRVTTWNYILVKIFLISNYSRQLVLFLLLHNWSSSRWELRMFPPFKCHWNLAVKTLLAAWRVLVGDVKCIHDDDSRDRHIPIGSEYCGSISENLGLAVYTLPCALVTSFIIKVDYLHKEDGIWVLTVCSFPCFFFFNFHISHSMPGNLTYNFTCFKISSLCTCAW